MKRNPACTASTANCARSVRTTVRSLLSFILVTAVCVALWAWVIKIEMDAMAPPPNVKTFEQFAAVMPLPTRLAVVSHGNELFIVWVDGYCGPVFVPSGPACYLFDSSGTLLQWTADTGDGSALDEYVRDAGWCPNQTVDDIRSLLRGRSRETSHVP